MPLAGLEIRLAAPAEVSGFNQMLAAHHYLGPRGSGVLRYLALLDGEPAVLATFGPAAWKCRPREELLGWDDEQRDARLGAIAGHQRLCVLPAGRQHAVLAARARHRHRGPAPDARRPVRLPPCSQPRPPAAKAGPT